MPRFTVNRAAVHAEVERRKAATPAAAAAPLAAPKPERWSAKVFVVPAAVAEALAKLATRTMFGHPPSGEPHSMRRHRGVYIWRPTMDQHGQPDQHGELEPMTDEHTAETEIGRAAKEELH